MNRAAPLIVIGGDADTRALLDELVDEHVHAVVTAAIVRTQRDVVALISPEGLVVFDRARLSTDPDVPEALRWLRNAPRGSWIIGFREDGASLRARIRFAHVSKGGDA